MYSTIEEEGKNMPFLYIDNKKVEFQNGETILEVAKRAEISIPTLCHLKKSGHGGICRICSVKVDGYDNYLPSCTSFALENMQVQTHSKELFELRKLILSDILAEGRHDCFMRGIENCTSAYQIASLDVENREHACSKDGRCELQDLVIEHQIPVKDLEAEKNAFTFDNAYPMIGRDFSRCIQCGRCASVCEHIQVNNAIEHQFGRKIEKENYYPFVDYEKCTHCGECLQACPTGALFSKKSLGLLNKKDEITKIRTTCPYCGTGCQQELLVKDGKIIEVNGVEDAEPNKGMLCVKGRFAYDFIYSEERLKTPLIRQEDNSFKEASWDEALTLIKDKFSEIIESSGPDALAGVSCSRSINEDSYQMQKLFRSVFKTNNIDNCART